MEGVRTNNNIEGWHNRLNRKANGKAQLPFYLMISLLHHEARLTAIQIRLVSEKKLQQQNRRAYSSVQGRLFQHWDEFAAGTRNTMGLLRACAELNYGPGRAE